MNNSSGNMIFTSRGLNESDGRIIFKKAFDQMKIHIDDSSPIVVICYVTDDEIPGYKNALVNGCVFLGFNPEKITLSQDTTNECLKHKISEADFIYVTEGNVYRLLKYLIDRELIESIRKSVLERSVIYLGASAGAAVAGTDIMMIEFADYDKDMRYMSDDDKNALNYFQTTQKFESLHLFDGFIIPHYDEREYIENLVSAYEDERGVIGDKYKYRICVGNEEYEIINSNIE